jgi:hypothetical protein
VGNVALGDPRFTETAPQPWVVGNRRLSPLGGPCCFDGGGSSRLCRLLLSRMLAVDSASPARPKLAKRLDSSEAVHIL